MLLPLPLLTHLQEEEESVITQRHTLYPLLNFPTNKHSKSGHPPTPPPLLPLSLFTLMIYLTRAWCVFRIQNNKLRISTRHNGEALVSYLFRYLPRVVPISKRRRQVSLPMT